jgi:hypothetical protein
MNEEGQTYFDENVSDEDRERLLKAQKELEAKELKSLIGTEEDGRRIVELAEDR